MRAILFAKWREAICDECLEVCRDIIEDNGKGHRVAPSRLALPKPAEIDDFLARLPERSSLQLGALLLPRPATSKPGPPPICSFCDAPDDAVWTLIAGPRAFICDTCVVQGTALLQQGSRLIEFTPRQMPASRPKAPRLPVLSDEQHARVLDGIRQELGRRQNALLSAMQVAAGTAAIDSSVVHDGALVTTDPETMLSSKDRDTFDFVVRFPIPALIIGGTSQGRRRLALRIHQLRQTRGPFVHIDCTAPGSLARMREGENGTLFLDDVSSLSTAGQELLGISLCDHPALRLRTRVVCAARDVESIESRIKDGEFSETLADHVCCCKVEMDSAD